MFPFTGRRTRRKLIMHRLASVSTSLLFAAHVLMGCCAHHAHGHAHPAVHAYAAAGQWSGCCPCDHHECDEAVSHDAGGRPGEPCSHGWCTYVRVEDTQIDHDGFQVPSTFFIPPPNATATAGCSSTEYVSMATADAPPAHLYLLHCALVI